MLQGRLDGSPIIPKIEAWYDRVSGLYVTGRLDACLRVELGIYAALDHKLLGFRPTEPSDAYTLQLDIYNLLLDKNGYYPADYGYLAYWVPESFDLDAGLPIAVDVRRVPTD